VGRTLRDLVLGKRNWRIAAAGSIAVSLILAGGIVWLSTRSRFVLYVVEVDKLGYALTAPQALNPDSSSQLTDDRIVRYELAGFIRSVHRPETSRPRGLPAFPWARIRF
jgi:type IV secretory pathway TrbF-like protein